MTSSFIAQEAIHSMRKKRGKQGWMAIKVDLEKAFDRLSWDFIQDTLLDARIPRSLVEVIMNCITSPTMQVIWNGKVLDHFRPTRGIRQGDPLSPYIFVLHERVSSETYAYILERVNRKLSGWNMKTLSLAGRITLAKSVLSTIPYYAMQITKLPSQCCHKLEKLIRDFVWGSDNTHHRSVS